MPAAASAADAAFATKDIVTTGLTVGNILLTVTWNILNRRHTDTMSRRNRRDSLAFDEWKVQRSELMSCLRKLEAAVSNVCVLANGKHAVDPLIDEINKEGRNVTNAHAALLRELDRTGWPEAPNFAYGPTSDSSGETAWDELNNILAEATEMDDADQIRHLLAGINPLFNRIAAALNGNVRAVTQWHQSESE
jgi:hypothetical protein